ncbi:MAG: ComEC family competence protein, partial [Ignavibacteriae bacterium]|nr:ComEC family competence protein [Ignavibacteriota bacterium]
MSLFDFHSYPALKVSALMIVGILIGDSLGLPVFLTGIATGCIFVLSLILAIVSHRIDRSSAWDTVALLLLCVLIGATKIGLDRSSSSITDDLFERPVTVTGKIVEPPARFDNRIRFLFRSNSLVADSMIVPFRFNILVTIKQTRGDTSTENLTYGRQLRVKGQISRPPEERNPGEFNARQYYEANGIPFFMFVRNPVHLAEVEVPEPSWSPMEWIMRETVVPVRLYIQSHIDGTIGGEEGEFLKGILIGDRTGISVATRQAFVNSGVAHILAVSGSNVAVLVVIFFFLFEMLRFPKQIKIVFTVVALWFYVLLTGSQPPVVRATVMATVFLIGLMVEHKSNAYNSLGLSALIILAFDARQVFDVGFQLSFVAVLSIIYLYPRANDWIRRIPARSLLHRLAIRVLQVCAVSAVATLGTLPFTALYFGRVSVVGVLTNIIVIPAAGLSIVLGFVSSVAGLLSSWLEQVYASANHFILYWTMIVARVSGGLSVAYVDTLQFT